MRNRINMKSGMCMWGLITVILICFLFNIASVDEKPDSLKTISAINTPEEAISRALEFTGFDKCESYTKHQVDKITKLITVIDTTTPFLHQKINGRLAWQVIFAGIVLDKADMGLGYEHKKKKDFEVLLDKKTGSLLKIIGRIKNPDPTLDTETEVKEAEKRMQSGGGETYHGFPDEMPNIKFFDIIFDSSYAAGRARAADEIIGIYAVYSRMATGPGPKPVWSISFIGPSSYRVVFDAMTGQTLIGIRSGKLPR